MTPTWDLFIIIFFSLIVILGIALGRERAAVGVIASYIGLVAANVWGNAIYNILGGTSATIGENISVTANVSPFIIKTVIFAIILVLLITKGDFLKKATTYHTGILSLLTAGIYSFLNAGIIVTALISFLSEAQRTELLLQSNLINTIVRYQTWWLVLPAILIIILGFKHTEE